MKKNILLKLFSVFLFLTVSNNYLFGQEIIYQQNFDGNNGTFSGNHEFINTTGVNGIYANTVGAQTGNPYYRHLWSVSSLGSGNFAPISGKSLGLGIYQDLSMFYANTPFRTYNGASCTVLPVTTRWAYIPISTVGYENIQVEFKWRATGEVSGSTVYDYGTFFTSINGGDNWLIDTNGGQAGNTNVDGNLSGGVYYNNPNVSTQILDLPSSRNNQPQFAIGFRMVVDECYGTGGAFIIDDIIVRGTPISTDRTLTVSEAYTGGTPANGFHTYTDGASVTATAGTRPGYNLLGWTGTGSVSPTGTTNSIAFNITQNSSIEWLWEAIQPEFHNYGGTEQLTFNNSKINTENPVFRLSHKGGTANGYQIQISNSADFTSGTVSQTFTGTSYAADTENNFTFTNESFTPGTTYYVRAAVDMGGGYLTDGWTTETYSFTYQSEQEIPSWFQTTQAQFQTNVLQNLTADDQHDVVVSTGGLSPILNPSFETNANWTSFKTSGSALDIVINNTGWATQGSRSARMYMFGGHPLSSDVAVISQLVDLTNVEQIIFDAKSYYGPNGTSSLSNGGTLKLIIGGTTSNTEGVTVATINHCASGSSSCNVPTLNYIANIPLAQRMPDQTLKFVWTGFSSGNLGGALVDFMVDNVRIVTPSQGTITSTPIHLASVQDATGYDTFKWNQTPGTGDLKFDIQGSSDGINFDNIPDYTNISQVGSGEKTHDISGIDPEIYPHLRLVGKLNGENAVLHDWSVQFMADTQCADSTIWNGSSWSNGIPSSSDTKIIFNGNFTSDLYNTTAGELVGCSVEVQSGNVVLSEGHNLIIDNEITVTSGSFTLKDGANLVQINDDAVNSGNITAEKGFTFSDARNQYNFVISPVKDQNIKELFETNDYLAQKYNEETNYFDFFEDGEYLGAGIGQAIQENQEDGNVQTATYEGEPHNGIIKVDSLSNGYSRYHLAGNPYPSQLDLVQFYTDNEDNIESTFLFWDNRGNTQITQQGNDYNGSNYASFNIEAGNGTGTGTAASGATGNLRVPTQKVAVGNAFMLQLKTGNSYTFKNAQRVGGQGQNFLGRNYSTDGIVSSEIDRYWLTLNTPGGISAMNAVVYFDGGNDAFAKDDSKITGGSDDIFTLVDEHQLKIQGKSSFDVNDKIQLGYKAYAAGVHTISIYDSEGVFADGQKIFIRDFQTGIVHELTQSDFTFKTFAGEFNDRFEIFYKRSIKASENKATLSNVVIYQNKNHIQIAAENQLLSDVEIYDLNGISVYQATDINLENWKVPNHLFGKGILVVVVKTADGEVVNKKLINK